MTDTDLEQTYRARIEQMGDLIHDCRRLIDWMKANGAGSHTAIASTLAEHETRLAKLEEVRYRVSSTPPGCVTDGTSVWVKCEDARCDLRAFGPGLVACSQSCSVPGVTSTTGDRRG